MAEDDAIQSQESIDSIKHKKSIHYAVKGCHEAAFSIKDVDTVGRTVTGFYNTYNFFDSDCDVLLPGAAKQSIKMRGPKSQAYGKIKHALFHNLTQLPGRIKVLEEKAVGNMTGIYFETQMSDTVVGNDTLKNYLDGIYDNHSIGFQYLQLERIDREAKGWKKAVEQLINPEDAEKAGLMYLVKEIALFEGSTVAFGANKLTPYLGVKSANDKDSLKLALFKQLNTLQHVLRSGTQSEEMMQTFEIQTHQMKQMLSELVDAIQPTEKIIPEIKKDTSEVQEPIVPAKKALDLEYICKNFSIKP